jgi:putative peptide zinc metalloprotease protein
MRFGPTSLQVSSILAKGLRRPKLRSGLRISEQTISGEASVVIKIPETNSYNRYGSFEYGLLRLCDGTRTAREIAETLTRQRPDEPLDETEVLEFLDGVEPAMWERSLGEKNLAVLARIRDERKSRLDQSSILYLSFRAWDPDKFLTRIDPYFGWLFTRGFVIFSVLLFFITLYLFATDWTRIQNDTKTLYSFSGKTAYDIWIFWTLLLVLGAIHECGHGLTCKHFGGEVHQMGFMLIYFTPAFYTDTTDILLFDRASRRQWVIFAGLWIELVVCGLATLLCHFTTPGMLIYDLAYKTMLLSGIQGALFNLNPLIKADGYYALSQYFGVDNLRDDSFAFLKVWTRRHLLLEDVQFPPAARRLRRIYLGYGIIAFVYSIALLAISIFLMKNVFISVMGNWGYLVYALVLYLLVIRRTRKGFSVFRRWAKEKCEVYMAWKITRTQKAAAYGLLILILLTPVSSDFSSELVLEPHREAWLRPEVSGLLHDVNVRGGDSVSAGQIVAALENPSIDAQERILKSQLAIAESGLRSARNQPGSEKAADYDRERRRLSQELEVAERQQAGLRIRAQFEGIVKTPELDQKPGEFFDAGEEFCEVVDRSQMKARILVSDTDLDRVTLGASVHIKVYSFPYRTFSGRVGQILPAAAKDRPVGHPQKEVKLGQELTNYFAVVMEFPNSDGALVEGMTGTAKIGGPPRPLVFQMGRAFWRWFQSQLW